MKQYAFKPIATVHSCFTEKFGIPRQPGLVESEAQIVLAPEFADETAFRELETFSHIWIIFVFNGLGDYRWKPTVRPPRLGGNQRLGVFASRSMFRPNPLGLSVVKLERIEKKQSSIILHVSGADLLDGTPVLDIKPYVPYADAIVDAEAGYAGIRPEKKFKVQFSQTAQKALSACIQSYPRFETILTQVLELDPRPAYQNRKTSSNNYVMQLYHYDISWQVEADQIIITQIEDRQQRT